jgi:hypothetical protein
VDALGHAIFFYARRNPVNLLEIQAVVVLQRAARPNACGIVPLHDADPFAFQIPGRFDAGFAVHKDIGLAEFAIRKSRYGNMRRAVCVGAQARGKAAIPGIGFVFSRHKLPIEAFNLYRAVGNGHIRVNGRLAEIEAQFWVGHDQLSFTLQLPSD